MIILTYSQGQRKALFAKCEKEKLQNKVPASKLKRFWELTNHLNIEKLIWCPVSATFFHHSNQGHSISPRSVTFFHHFIQGHLLPLSVTLFHHSNQGILSFLACFLLKKLSLFCPPGESFLTCLVFQEKEREIDEDVETACDQLQRSFTTEEAMLRRVSDKYITTLMIMNFHFT